MAAGVVLGRSCTLTSRVDNVFRLVSQSYGSRRGLGSRLPFSSPLFTELRRMDIAAHRETDSAGARSPHDHFRASRKGGTSIRKCCDLEVFRGFFERIVQE